MAEKGVSGLFAGVSPRVTWISIGITFKKAARPMANLNYLFLGGAVFFGVYEKAKSVLS